MRFEAWDVEQFSTIDRVAPDQIARHHRVDGLAYSFVVFGLSAGEQQAGNAPQSALEVAEVVGQ